MTAREDEIDAAYEAMTPEAQDAIKLVGGLIGVAIGERGPEAVTGALLFLAKFPEVVTASVTSAMTRLDDEYCDEVRRIVTHPPPSVVSVVPPTEPEEEE